MTGHQSGLRYEADALTAQELPKEWGTPTDIKTFTFMAIYSVKWHDGKPLTVAEAKCSIEYCRRKVPGADWM